MSWTEFASALLTPRWRSPGVVWDSTAPTQNGAITDEPQGDRSQENNGSHR
jgi:hypothetical protein